MKIGLGRGIGRGLRSGLVLGLGLGIGLVGCRQPGEDQKTESIGAADVRQERTERSPEFIAHLDSGNAAYRAKDYENALRHYQAVTRIDEDEAAGWFGIYMTELARGNAAAADLALKRAQEHAPGASLIHP